MARKRGSGELVITGAMPTAEKVIGNLVNKVKKDIDTMTTHYREKVASANIEGGARKLRAWYTALISEGIPAMRAAYAAIRIDYKSRLARRAVGV